MTEHDLYTVAIPKLNEAQMAALGRCAGAALKQYHNGEKLIETGDRDFKFFVTNTMTSKMQPPTYMGCWKKRRDSAGISVLDGRVCRA